MVCHTASVTGGLLILICVCQCAKYASMDYSSRPISYAAGSRRKIKVIEYGEPCECCKVLPYHVEVPQTPTDPILQEYQYSVDIPPTPVKDERRFSYDYKVLVPKEDPIAIGCSYDYRVEIPPEPEKETKYSFSYELQVPKPDPQPQPKTYAYSYQITQPEAPKPAEPLKLYSYQLEVPQPQTETRLTGLLAEVDTVVVPRRCGCRRCETDEKAAYSKLSAPVEGASSDEDTNNCITEYANFGSGSSIYASVGSRYSPTQHQTRYKSRRTRRATDYTDQFGSIPAGKFSILTYNEDRAANNVRSKDDIDIDPEFYYNGNEFVKTHKINEPRIAEIEDKAERSSPMSHVYDKHSQTYHPELSSTSKYSKSSNCGCKNKVESSEEMKGISNQQFQRDLLQSTSVPSTIKRDEDVLYISSEEDMRAFGDRPWFYYNRQAFNEKDVNVLGKRSNWEENRDDEINENFPQYERNFKESINRYKVEKLPAIAQTYAKNMPVNSNAESSTDVVIAGGRSQMRRSKNRKNASKSIASKNVKMNGMNANSSQVKNSHPEGMSAETSNRHQHDQRDVTTIHKRSDNYDDDDYGDDGYDYDEYTSRIVKKEKVKRRNNENNEVLKSETNKNIDVRTLEKSDNTLKREEDMGHISFEGKKTISRSHTQRNNSSKRKTVQRDTKIIRRRGTEDEEYYHNNENVRNGSNAYLEKVSEEQKLKTAKRKSQAKNYTNNSERKTRINSRDVTQDQRAKRDNNNQQFVITQFPSKVNYPDGRRHQYDKYEPIHDYDKFENTEKIGRYIDSERKHNSFNARPSSLHRTSSPIYQQLLPITKENGYYTKYGFINEHTDRKSDHKIPYTVNKQCICKPIYNKFEGDHFWNEGRSLKNVYNAKKHGSGDSEVDYDLRKYSENIKPLTYSVPNSGHLVNYVARPYGIKINQPDHHRCYEAKLKEKDNGDSSYGILSFRGYKDLPKHNLYESGLKYKSHDVKDEDYMQVASDNKNEFYLKYRNKFIPEGYPHSYPHSQYDSVDEIKNVYNIKAYKNVKNDLLRSVPYVPNYVQYLKPNFERKNYHHNFETIPLVRNADIYIKSTVPTFSSNQFQSQSEQETVKINNAKEIAQETEAQEYGIVQEQSTNAKHFAANLKAGNANNFTQNTAEEIEGIYSFTSSNVENQTLENATNEGITNSNSGNINLEYISTGSFQNNLALERNGSLQLEVEDVLTVPPIQLNYFLNQAQELQAVELLTDALQSEIEKSMSKIAEIQELNNDVVEKERRIGTENEKGEKAKDQLKIESTHNSDKNFDNTMFLKTKATERKGDQYPRHKDKHIKDVWENYNVYDSVLSGKNVMYSQDCRRDQTTKAETISTAKYEQILPQLPHLIDYKASSTQKYPVKRKHLKFTKNPENKKCKKHKPVIKNHDLASENVVQLSKKCGNILHDNEIIKYIQKTCDSGYEVDTYEIIKSLFEPNYYIKQELKDPSTTYFLPEGYELKHINEDIVSNYPDEKYTYDEIMRLIGCDEFKKYTCNDILKLIGCDACQCGINELYRKEQDKNDISVQWHRFQPQNSFSTARPEPYYHDKPNKIVKGNTASNVMTKEEIKKLLREINAIQSIVKTWYLKSVGKEAKKDFVDEIKVSEVTQEDIQDMQLVVTDLYHKYLQYRDVINYDIDNVLDEIETACQIQHEIDSIQSIVNKWYHMNYLRNRVIGEDIENIINEDIKKTEVLVGELEDDLQNIRQEVSEWSHSQATTEEDEYKNIGGKIVTTSPAQESLIYGQPIIDDTSSSIILDKDGPNNEFNSIKNIIWRLNHDLEEIQPILTYICQMHKTSHDITNEVGGGLIAVVTENGSLIPENSKSDVINVTTEDTIKLQVENDKHNTLEDWKYKHRTYSAEIGEDDTGKSENKAVGTIQIVLIPFPNSIKKDYPSQKLFWESSPSIKFHELNSDNTKQKTNNYYKHDNVYDEYNDSPYFTFNFIKESEKENSYPNSVVQGNNEYHNNINKCSNRKSSLQKYDVQNKKILKAGTYPTSKFILGPQESEIDKKHLTHSEISDFKQNQYISVPSRPEIQFVPYKHVEYKEDNPMRMKKVREKYTPYENFIYYPPSSHERLRRSTEFHMSKSKEYQEIKIGEHETQIKAPIEVNE